MARTQIRASAGSGKTYRITMDFLDLLAGAGNREPEGCMLAQGDGAYGWQEIMAVTFTNAAAAEMRKRVVDTLKKVALGKEKHKKIGTAEAGRWVGKILERFGALNIKTIDSLLHTVVRLGALELNLPPDFEPVFNTAEALEPLLDTLLESTRDHAGFAALLNEACREVVWHAPNFRGFQAGTKVREQVLSLVLPLCQEGVAERLATTDLLVERYAALTADVVATAKGMQTCVSKEKLQASKYFKDALEACIKLGPKDDVPGSTMLRKDTLDECLNKASKGIASEEALGWWEDLHGAVFRLERHGALLRAGMRLAPFAGLARLLAQALPAHLSAEGRVPQALIPQLAARVLAEGHGVPETFCRMGASLTHVLIDEFQDTNRDQWNAIQPLALEALSRGGSLTWVGDVKQAIYGWRGGDATLFEEVASDAELCQVAPDMLRDTLPWNRRSLEEVVLFNNGVFERLADAAMARQVLTRLLPKETPEETLETGVNLLMQAFEGAAQKPLPEKTGGYVRVETVVGEKADDLEEQVQERFCEMAEELLTRRRPADMAVLVRSNKQVALAAGWLMSMGVRVVTENSFLLGAHPLVREILDLLTFLDTPEDDAAFLGFVLGTQLFLPMSGLDEPTIHRWLTGVANRDGNGLYTLFRRDFGEAWDLWIEPFFGAAGLLAAYDTIREALARFDAENRLAGQAVFAQRLLEVCHVAESEGHASVSAFLAYWKEHGSEEKAPMPAGLDAVQIMTIHKSKGRQFPVVICPWQNLDPDADSDPEVMELDTKIDHFQNDTLKHDVFQKQNALENGLCVLARPAKGLDTYYTSLADSAREALHRLYVAWTRAEEELYVLVTSSARRTKSAEVLGMLLDTDFLVPTSGGMEWGAPKTDGTVESVEEEEEPGRVTDMEKPEKIRAEDVEEGEPWRPMGWLPRLRIFRSPLAELAYTPKRRGVFAHHCLEYLRITGDAPKDAQRAVAEGLATFPVPIREPELARRDLENRLAWYAALPEAVHWMQYGVTERTILDGQGRLFRADLLVDDGTAVTVVDYKTGLPEAGHEVQVRGYMTLLREAQPLPVQGRLVYMDLAEVWDVQEV